MLADAFELSRVALAKLLKEARSDESVRALVDWFCAHRLDLEPLLAIDDLHLLVDDQLSMALLAALIERLHEARWLLISRRALPLPWGNWLAAGDASLAVAADDLALEPAEARALLAERAPQLDEGAIRAALSLADGWPIVLRFAQRAAERAGDLIALQAMTREMAFAYLAEQFASESPPQWRELALIAAFARWIDAEFLERCGIADPHAALRWLRESAFPIHDAPTRVSLHDLATEAIVRSATPQERTAILSRVVAALAACGRTGEALDLARTYAPERIDALLAREGFALLDAGRWESVEQALHAVSLERRRGEPMLLGVRAALEAFHGNVDRSEQLYLAAIRACRDPELHSALSRRLSLLYINLARPEALAAIAPAVDEGSAMSRADARSIHALALVVTGNLENAWDEVRAALEEVSVDGEEDLVARVSMRAAWVAFHCDRPADAERIAIDTLRRAQQLGDSALEAHLYSILCSLTTIFRDDFTLGRSYAEEMASAALRIGDRQLLAYARRVQFTIDVEQGDEERAARTLQTIEVGGQAYRNDYFFAYSHAIFRGWERRYKDAALGLIAAEQVVEDQFELRSTRAAIALFLAMANERDEALAYIVKSRIGVVPKTALAKNLDVAARTHLGLTEIFLGRPSLANRHIPKRAERPWDAALCQAAKELATPSSDEAVRSAIQRLRAAGRVGFARLLDGALEHVTSKTARGTLTRAELSILQGLANGKTPKNLADESGRSLETIRSHTHAIFRKLQAKNRQEAILFATRIGLIR